MTMIKICGLRNPSGYEQLLDGRIDAIGFVFATSKRQITATQPRAWRPLIEAMPVGVKRPQLVGVFVNPSLNELVDAVEVGSLDVIQLHGNESVEFCQQVKQSFPDKRVWKALSVPEGNDVPLAFITARMKELASSVDLFLVDTHDPKYVGGSGKTFSWAVIPQLKSIASEIGKPLLIAGGLTPENVSALISEYAPDGVDISGGVETEGIKDLQKIDSFIKRVNLQ